MRFARRALIASAALSCLIVMGSIVYAHTSSKAPEVAWSQAAGVGVAFPACGSSSPTGTCSGADSVTETIPWTVSPHGTLQSVTVSVSNGYSKTYTTNPQMSGSTETVTGLTPATAYTVTEHVVTEQDSLGTSCDAKGSCTTIAIPETVTNDYTQSFTTPGVSTSVCGVPAAPSNFQASCTNTAASFSWAAASGAASYQINMFIPSADACPAGWTDDGTSANYSGRLCYLQTTNLSASATLVAGHAYSASVYGENSAGYSSPSNYANFSCIAPEPDLTAGNITPTTATAGTAVVLSATISDATAATGKGFTDLFESASDANGTGATAIGTYASGALAANASNTATLSYTFASAGTYYIRVCADKSSLADATGVIAESNEDNNCGQQWTLVTVGNGSCVSNEGTSCTASNGCAGTIACDDSCTQTDPSCTGSSAALSCSRSPSSSTLSVGSTVTYTANPTGGASAPYVFTDTLGAVLQSGSSKTYTKTYNSAGDYAVSVSATGVSSAAACGTPVTIGSGTGTSCTGLSATISANPTRIAGTSGTTQVSWNASGVNTSCAITENGAVIKTDGPASCSVPNDSANRSISQQTKYCISCDGATQGQAGYDCVVVDIGNDFVHF